MENNAGGKRMSLTNFTFDRLNDPEARAEMVYGIEQRRRIIEGAHGLEDGTYEDLVRGSNPEKVIDSDYKMPRKLKYVVGGMIGVSALLAAIGGYFS